MGGIKFSAVYAVDLLGNQGEYDRIVPSLPDTDEFVPTGLAPVKQHAAV